jgi:hypothetical protein
MNSIPYEQGRMEAMQTLGITDAEGFAQMAEQDDTEAYVNQMDSDPENLKKLNKTPAWGEKSTLDAGDYSTRSHEMSAPRSAGGI